MRRVWIAVAGGSPSDRNGIIDMMAPPPSASPREGYRQGKKELICVVPEDFDGAPPSYLTVCFLNVPDFDDTGPSPAMIRSIRNRIRHTWNPATDTMSLIYFHDIRQRRLRGSCEGVIKQLLEGLELNTFNAVSIIVTHGTDIPFEQATKKMEKHRGNKALEKSMLKRAYLWEIYKPPTSYAELRDILDLHLILRSTEQCDWEERNRRVKKLKSRCKRSRVWKWIYVSAEFTGVLCIAAGALTATAVTGGLAAPTLMGVPLAGALLKHLCAREREYHAKCKRQLEEEKVALRNTQRQLATAAMTKVAYPTRIPYTPSSNKQAEHLQRLKKTEKQN